MSDKGFRYAEETLRVNEVYREAREVLVLYYGGLNELKDLKDERLTLEEKIADRRADLVAEERGKHSDMAVTRFEEHVKMQERRDEELRALRAALLVIKQKVSRKELDLEGRKAGLRVLTSRMEELGGLLHFMAALKNSQRLQSLQDLQATEPTDERKPGASPS